MKKIFLLLMTVIIFTTTSFAQTFTDLPEGHWAKAAVEEMVKAGIISGYNDGTFRPSENLSKLHSLLLVARIAGIRDNATAASNYASAYSSVLSKYSTQYKTDVAYLLGTGVLSESDLDTFVADDKINTGLTREEMAILVTKVLGKEKEATSKSLIILSFSDASSISPKAKPYVHFVSTEGYMNGVENGKFAPQQILTRGQAAAVFQRIYKLVDIKPSNSNSSSSESVTSVTGTITKINTTSKTVSIKDKASTKDYTYDSSTEFYVDSKKKTSSVMAKDAKVTIIVNKNNYISVMNVSEGANLDTETVSGTISSVDTSKKTVTIKKSSKTYKYNYDSSTKFTLDGKSSTASKALVKDKEVTLTLEDDYIITAKVTTPESIVIGKIIEASKTTGYIVIEDDDGDEYIIMDDYLEKYDDGDEDFYFDKDTSFYYNSSSKSYTAISSTSYLYKKDYYVKVTFDGDFVEKLEVGSTKSKVDSTASEDEDKDDDEESIIGEIIEASKTYGYVIIEDDDGDEYIIMDDYLEKYDDGDEDFYFDKDTSFYYNSSSKSYTAISSTSYLYKKGYYVKLVLDGDFVEKLEVGSTKSKVDSAASEDDDDEAIIGEIIEASKTYGYVIIEDDDGEEYIIMDDYLEKYDDGDEDFYFDKDTSFYYNSSSKSYSAISSTSYLYKKGYYVKLVLDGDFVEKLEVGSTKSKLTSSSSSSSSSSNDIDNGFVYGYIVDWEDDYIDIEDDDGNEYSFEIENDCVIIKRSSDDPKDDLYEYGEDYDDVLEEDDEVVIFVCDEDDGYYYTSLIILLD